jgi:hypothetical protein
MIIPSETAKSSRYGEDAIEAFYTAVDNGQARLAMSILVDIIEAFAEKIEALEEAASPVAEVKPPAKEQVKVEEQIEEEVKPAPKAKVKETVSE